MTLDSLLARGLTAMHIDLAAPQRAQLLAYLGLLQKWNQHYNLTAIRDPEQMVPRHLLDSLSVLPFLTGSRALDIGTGAGLPGIVLAVARPDVAFTLLDSNAKKISFVRQAIHELGLANCTAVQARAEAWRAPQPFDSITARAFSSLAELLPKAMPLCAPDGRLLAMKGVFPEEELKDVRGNYGIDVKTLAVPGLDAARHLVIVTPH